MHAIAGGSGGMQCTLPPRSFGILETASETIFTPKRYFSEARVPHAPFLPIVPHSTDFYHSSAAVYFAKVLKEPEGCLISNCSLASVYDL